MQGKVYSTGVVLTLLCVNSPTIFKFVGRSVTAFSTTMCEIKQSSEDCLYLSFCRTICIVNCIYIIQGIASSRVLAGNTCEKV